MSTLTAECPVIEDKGGYIVHAVPAPPSMRALPHKRKYAGGKSQKLILFNRGKAISGALIKVGINQFP